MKNLSTFAHLKYIVQLFLKQMFIKYINRSLILFIGVILFSSCLNNSSTYQSYEPSSDPQLYAFSATARYDSTETLKNAKFSIDQKGVIDGKPRVFNPDSLEFGFVPKNALLNVTTKTNGEIISLSLSNPDSSFNWNRQDSVDLSRLKSIEINSEDGKYKMLYEFKLNVHKQNPNIITWVNVEDNYLTAQVNEQKTILLGNSFYTFYRSNGILTGLLTNRSTPTTHTPFTISGLPANTIISTIHTISNGETTTGFALEQLNNVYKSTNGSIWTSTNNMFPVRSILGNMHSAGTDSILVIVENVGKLTFAKSKDLNSFHLLNDVPVDFPISGFTSVSFENPLIFSAKFIIVAGGSTASGSLNHNSIWILKESDNKITTLKNIVAEELQGSNLFPYDSKLYLFAQDGAKNIIYSSENYGVNWTKVNTSQALPTDFTYRKNASVLKDTDNFIWIFGGSAINNTQLSDIWRGRLNRLVVN